MPAKHGASELWSIALVCFFANACLFRDKIVTGSFDRKAKIWDANTGQRYHTLKGHKLEIVCLSFDPHGMLVATGSMDNTAKLWDVETGQEIFSLEGHGA